MGNVTFLGILVAFVLRDLPGLFGVLYNPDGTPSGYWVSSASHRPSPPVEHDVFDETRAVVGLDVLGLGLISVVMTGPSSVDVYFEGTAEGHANDDDGDMYDDVTTVMKTLERWKSWQEIAILNCAG